jgi:hypothetical protein
MVKKRRKESGNQHLSKRSPENRQGKRTITSRTRRKEEIKTNGQIRREVAAPRFLFGAKLLPASPSSSSLLGAATFLVV